MCYKPVLFLFTLLLKLFHLWPLKVELLLLHVKIEYHIDEIFLYYLKYFVIVIVVSYLSKRHFPLEKHFLFF